MNVLYSKGGWGWATKWKRDRRNENWQCSFWLIEMQTIISHLIINLVSIPKKKQKEQRQLFRKVLRYRWSGNSSNRPLSLQFQSIECHLYKHTNMCVFVWCVIERRNHINANIIWFWVERKPTNKIRLHGENRVFHTFRRLCHFICSKWMKRKQDMHGCCFVTHA